jgi:DNA repair photolyase
MLFKVIKRFSYSEIRFAVNIDPILPLLTDSSDEIESIVVIYLSSSVCYIFGDILRLVGYLEKDENYIQINK